MTEKRESRKIVSAVVGLGQSQGRTTETEAWKRRSSPTCFSAWAAIGDRDGSTASRARPRSFTGQKLDEAIQTLLRTGLPIDVEYQMRKPGED